MPRLGGPIGTLTGALLLLLLSPSILAHEHHEQVSHEDAAKPIDTILLLHIFLQAGVWLFLFPVGMVLGITRSRWHVPLQSLGFALTVVGYFLGHGHGGRAFPNSVHGTFANLLLIPGGAQLALGIYLKLHIHEQSVRPYAVILHGVIGKLFPVLGWLQVVFGYSTLGGYCRGGHLGQCLAHYIMGSAFVGYGCVLAILLLVGEPWLRRKGRSPEWWDSWVITLWGIVNTFTEHHGGGWSMKDMQHTMLGVIWWAGGMLGIWLSRNNQRNVVPALIIILTGWSMSNHAQALMISTMVHSVFGYALMTAGITRIIEVCFLANTITHNAEPISEGDSSSEHTLADSSTSSPVPRWLAFRHLPPFLLVTAGFLFMSATDEELHLAHDNGLDHVTYVLMCISCAFIVYLSVLVLIHLYTATGRHSTKGAQDADIEMSSTGRPRWYNRLPNNDSSTTRNGQPAHVIGDDD
ncbi:hypothetical protein BDV98DRAFT_563444 [Pterulicium gracile]|uniref:Protein YTP1-like C-terminal domain-containing protein n=1 Tax=Pterulicium gracile TaxID=1884261 RepID=A0A5C3QPX3_9AGAR|nr:hypothetical protein BDV98DRAFT_563444 [Pterula gracilis]